MKRNEHGPNEHVIQTEIVEWLEKKHYLWWRNNSGMAKRGNRYIKLNKQGSPDIYVLRKGQLIGIEVKAEGNDQSREQVCFQTEFERAGGKYVVAWKLSDVEAVLR